MIIAHIIQLLSAYIKVFIILILSFIYNKYMHFQISIQYVYPMNLLVMDCNFFSHGFVCLKISLFIMKDTIYEIYILKSAKTKKLLGILYVLYSVKRSFRELIFFFLLTSKNREIFLLHFVLFKICKCKIIYLIFDISK